MSRRGLTLLLASMLALLLTSGAVQARVPYVALGPGPTFNTLGEVDGTPVLELEGRRTYETTGHLDLTTVGVQSPLTLAQAVRGWFDRDLAVVPREALYPPDKSEDEVDRENAEAMEASQSSATTAAARQLGLRTAQVLVKQVPEGAPAQGRLRVGDVLTTVDGRAVRDAADLRSFISRREVGQPVRIGFERSGETGTAAVGTTASDDDEQRPVIGVVTEEEPVDAPFSVAISLEEVVGPSAGLMFALGILDKLDEPSLTGGKYIAGTGEITRDGTVRPIGGIPQKLVAARAKGAVAFLVPEQNCPEAVLNAPDGLLLLEVGSLDDALRGLTALRRDTPPELCSAA